MRYGDFVTNGEEYIALFDDVLVFDKDGNPQTQEQMMGLVQLKKVMDANPMLYDALRDCIQKYYEDDFLKTEFCFALVQAKIVALGFLYKFLGQDIFDKLGYYKHVLVDSVAQSYIFFQKWRKHLTESYHTCSVSVFDSLPKESFFDALAVLAPFKDEIVTTMQANLDKLGFSNKGLALYDCSNVSFRESSLEDKLKLRLKAAMVDTSIFRYNDFRLFELNSYFVDISHNNGLANKAQSLATEGFTSIPHYEQFSGEGSWDNDAVPVVSYALVMDNQGMIVDFELIKAMDCAQAELISAVKNMQSKHNFENIAIFVDNEWSQPWEYIAQFKLEGISYMVNDHFHFYTSQQIKELRKSLKFSQTSTLTLVNGAEPDRFACSNFESINYANTPFEVTYKISEDDAQLMLQKGVAEVGAKGSHDILLNQHNQELVVKGQTFITFMSDLLVKETLLKEEGEIDWWPNKGKYSYGFKSFECDQALFKGMGSKTGISRSFNKFNTTKSLFKKGVENLNLNDAAISADGICGHMLTVYCAMVLRQLLQFHPHIEGKVLSNDQTNELFYDFDLLSLPFVMAVDMPASKKSSAPESQLDLVLNSKISFVNNLALKFAARANNDPSTQRFMSACQALGFNPEAAAKQQMTMADLAKFINMPQDALQKVLYEQTYSNISSLMAQGISDDFAKMVR